MYNELCPRLLCEPVGNIKIALEPICLAPDGRARWQSVPVLKSGSWFVESR